MNGTTTHHLIKPSDVQTTRKSKGIIHLIDDEKDIVSAATMALEREGCEVHSFTSVSELLKDIQTKCGDNISMLITDVRMPGGSGFEVARKVRAITPDVPIIFMTAFEVHSSEFDRVFPSLRVDEFIQKPFHVGELLKLVAKYT